MTREEKRFGSTCQRSSVDESGYPRKQEYLVMNINRQHSRRVGQDERERSGPRDGGAVSEGLQLKHGDRTALYGCPQLFSSSVLCFSALGS